MTTIAAGNSGAHFLVSEYVREVEPCGRLVRFAFGVTPVGLYVLAQPVAEGFAVENDLLARILQVSLAPELIHEIGRAHV